MELVVAILMIMTNFKNNYSMDFLVCPVIFLHYCCVYSFDCWQKFLYQLQELLSSNRNF